MDRNLQKLFYLKMQNVDNPYKKQIQFNKYFIFSNLPLKFTLDASLHACKV